jgi:hypothetical protein
LENQFKQVKEKTIMGKDVGYKVADQQCTNEKKKFF